MRQERIAVMGTKTGLLPHQSEMPVRRTPKAKARVDANMLRASVISLAEDVAKAHR